MGIIDRYFRLTNEPGGLGLSCTPSGLSLAGVPLFRKFGADFAVRPVAEIEALVRAAYGAETDGGDLLSGLETVARALNRGELAHATIAAVLMRLPELSWDAAARLASADDELRKYNFNPNEPRDRYGYWISDEGFDSSGQDSIPDYPADFGEGDDDAEPPDDRPPLERKYDDLGPVEFSKQVIQFGYRLGQAGDKLSPQEKQDALTEYNFLQSRLSFWQFYPLTPFDAKNNLNSAALTLYWGAVLSGIVEVGGKHGGLPSSYIMAALGAMALDDSQPGLPVRGRSIGTELESGLAPPKRGPPAEGVNDVGGIITPFDNLGGIVDNARANVDWNAGIKERGIAWERYIAAENPDATILKPGSKTFDLFHQRSGQAISAKTLDSLTYSYINNPQRIYNRIKGYVDAAANYNKQRAWFDLLPSVVKMRVVRLGVHDYVSQPQWQQLRRAILYGRSRGVLVDITRIKD